MNWLEKLLQGETLEGEEVLQALQGLGWRSAVRAALMLLDEGEVAQARAVLEDLVADADTIDQNVQGSLVG
jgi:hypothetical protein